MDKFEYEYSAANQSERNEIERIRSFYAPQDDRAGKIAQLKKLNDMARRPANITAIILGIAGVLIFGFGMCLCLVWDEFVWGIIAGLAGIAILAAVLPLHSCLLKKGKQKYAKRIIELSDDLLRSDQ